MPAKQEFSVTDPHSSATAIRRENVPACVLAVGQLKRVLSPFSVAIRRARYRPSIPLGVPDCLRPAIFDGSAAVTCLTHLSTIQVAEGLRV
jgi:hypothetical protein